MDRVRQMLLDEVSLRRAKWSKTFREEELVASRERADHLSFSFHFPYFLVAADLSFNNPSLPHI